MNLSFSVPGKTFLVGEYAVLGGGPALVLGTRPRFELRARRGPTGRSGLPAGSPAARWCETHAGRLEGWQIEFIDPHAGQGGLGASGAQFGLVHRFTSLLAGGFAEIGEPLKVERLWNDYQSVSGGVGSGADLLAQSVGQVAHVDMATLSATALAWPYAEIGWGLVRTHKKVATHEHLRGLDPARLSLLKAPAQACVEDFGRAGPEVFLARVKDYAARLCELGLQADTTGTLVRLLEAEPWCLATKGCGALGADVVLFFYPAPEREKALAFVRKQRLTLLATNLELTYGLDFRCR